MPQTFPPAHHQDDLYWEADQTANANAAAPPKSLRRESFSAPVVKAADDFVSGGDGTNMTQSVIAEEADAGYHGYPQRWIVLIIFSIATALSAYIWITFAGIYAISNEFFDQTDPNAVPGFAITYYAFFGPGSIAALWTMQKYGLRACILVAATCMCLSGWIRYLGALLSPSGQTAFIVVMFGQCIAAAGQPFTLQAPARIANDWFPTKERDFATIFMTMSNVIGNALGAVVPTYQVTTSEGGMVPNGIPMMLLCQAIPATVLVVLTWFFFADRPPTPPSAAVADQLRQVQKAKTMLALGQADANVHTHEGVVVMEALSATDALRQLFKDSLALLKNWNFIFILVSFSIEVGMSWTYAGLIGVLIPPCGYDPNIAGWAGAGLLGAGVVTSFLVGPIMVRTHAYALIYKTFLVLTTAMTLWTLGANQPGNVGMVLASWLMMGAMSMPLIPVAFELAAEVTFPIPADNSAAFLMFGANTLALILTFALVPAYQLEPSAECTTPYTVAALIVLIFMLVGTTAGMPIRADYRRLRTDEALASANSVGNASAVNGSATGNGDAFVLQEVKQ